MDLCYALIDLSHLLFLSLLIVYSLGASWLVGLFDITLIVYLILLLYTLYVIVTNCIYAANIYFITDVSKSLHVPMIPSTKYIRFIVKFLLIYQFEK